MANEGLLRTDECRRFDAELGPYLEGEGRPFVPAHATQCRFCEVVLADLEAIRSAGRALPLEGPSPAVWANVRANLRAEGIIHEPVSLWQQWLGSNGFLRTHAPLGALTALLVFAVVLLNTSRRPPHSPGTDFAGGEKVVSASIGLPDQQQLETTLLELETSFRAREATLDPALKAAYIRGLESLNESIRECSESVRRQPENTLARQYLLSAYTQKAEILETALEFDAH
ncbi:MAG TPA: hypothetical protein VFD30_05305 [Terriglobia bacterium]|jgi:hypothetical protein|nr:hypothetical protein [Terriglobia bacterium]